MGDRLTSARQRAEVDLSPPFFQEQGRGEGVLCLHSNASTSSQWRQLSDLLSGRFHVVAADGCGAGKSPDWSPSTDATLDAEIDFLSPVLRAVGEQFHVVGHSYGAALALQLAAPHPKRVLSVAMYEPTLFYLVAGGDPSTSPAAGIWQASSDAAALVGGGNNASAAERFVDFWMTEGSWRQMPGKRQDMVARSVRNVGRWREATFAQGAPATAFAALQMPVLLMWGDCSPESSQSVVRLLGTILADVTSAPQPGLGHMGPITDPERVNAQIASFLDLHRRPSS
ncbi:MAG: alpha/beta hydrolase [Caldimonas sp.]